MLPTATLKWMLPLVPTFASPEHMRRGLLMRLNLWRDGSVPMRIPGYEAPPPDLPGTNHPAGWDSVTFANLFTPTAKKP